MLQGFKQGKYYNSKVVVEDVSSPTECICRTDDGRILEGKPGSRNASANYHRLKCVCAKSHSTTVMQCHGVTERLAKTSRQLTDITQG
jgi:hypothetical protein